MHLAGPLAGPLTIAHGEYAWDRSPGLASRNLGCHGCYVFSCSSALAICRLIWAISSAVEALAAETEAFAARRMNRTIADALTGRRVDELGA